MRSTSTPIADRGAGDNGVTRVDRVDRIEAVAARGPAPTPGPSAPEHRAGGSPPPAGPSPAVAMLPALAALLADAGAGPVTRTEPGSTAADGARTGAAPRAPASAGLGDAAAAAPAGACLLWVHDGTVEVLWAEGSR